MIDAIELRSILSYNPHTGVFKWRENLSPRARKGKVAGWLENGYRRIKIQNITYAAHRLVWLYQTGHLPDDDKEIDHINNDRDDNRLVNLREVTHAENQLNRIDTKRNGGFYIDRRKEYNRAQYYKHREKRLEYQREYARKKGQGR